MPLEGVYFRLVSSSLQSFSPRESRSWRRSTVGIWRDCESNLTKRGASRKCINHYPPNHYPPTAIITRVPPLHLPSSISTMPALPYLHTPYPHPLPPSPPPPPPLPPSSSPIRQQLISRHEHEMRDLGDVMYAMELRHNERETKAKLEFQSLMDEIKNKVRETGSSS